jgi:acetyl esterase
MTDPYVRADVRAYLDLMAANPRPKFSDAMMAMMRAVSFEQMRAMFDLIERPQGELGEVRDLTMPGPGGDIALRLFDLRSSRDPGPVVVFYHGGGFVTGSIDTHASLCAEIARGLDLPVVSVDYRLAPENPWPAGPDDAEAAARWVAENGAALGREFTGLILAGDSAGATLTIVAALALRDTPAALPVIMQFPIYPKVDSTQEFESARAFSSGFGLDGDDMGYFTKAYAADPQSHRGSPLLADQAGMPPTLVVTAALDPLRDEGRAYAAKAIAAGVDVTYREVAGTIHGFFTYRKAIPSAHDDLLGILAHARAMLATLPA